MRPCWPAMRISKPATRSTTRAYCFKLLEFETFGKYLCSDTDKNQSLHLEPSQRRLCYFFDRGSRR